MNRVKILLPLIALALLAGCSDEFVSEEMLLGDEAKLRPLAIVCEPAEASPGQLVTVTFTYWDPHPEQTTTNWRVALDYDEGLYGGNPVERNFQQLGVPGLGFNPQDDGHGFMTETFSWQVPDDVLQNTSAIPEQLDEEPWLSLSQAIAPGETLTRQQLDLALASLTESQLNDMTEEQKTLVLQVVDLFACQVRFRVQLRADLAVDVTRNFTVRHSRRLNSPNTNRNTDLATWTLLAVPAPDVAYDDVEGYGDAVERIPLLSTAGTREVVVEAHQDWTYYIRTSYYAQQYTSPFSGDRLFTENAEFRWYSFRLDEGDRGYPLVRNEDGDEAEMWELDDWIRVVPPQEDSTFRVYVCLRDERPEWSGSQGAPGANLRAVQIDFSADVDSVGSGF